MLGKLCVSPLAQVTSGEKGWKQMHRGSRTIWSVPAKGLEIFSEERLHTRQTEVGESRTRVEETNNALSKVSNLTSTRSGFQQTFKVRLVQ